MKKFLSLLLAACTVFALTACGADSAANESDSDESVTIDYGSSSIYSKEDMDDAIALITAEFATWEGCELHTIEYAGDDCNSTENIEWMNSLDEGMDFTQCIAFISSFHSPVAGGGAWEPDKEYEGWSWYLARTDGGEWQLLTWGY